MREQLSGLQPEVSETRCMLWFLLQALSQAAFLHTSNFSVVCQISALLSYLCEGLHRQRRLLWVRLNQPRLHVLLRCSPHPTPLSKSLPLTFPGLPAFPLQPCPFGSNHPLPPHPSPLGRSCSCASNRVRVTSRRCLRACVTSTRTAVSGSRRSRRRLQRSKRRWRARPTQPRCGTGWFLGSFYRPWVPTCLHNLA